MITRRGSGGSAHPKHNVLNHIEIAFATIELHPSVLFAPIGVHRGQIGKMPTVMAFGRAPMVIIRFGNARR